MALTIHLPATEGNIVVVVGDVAEVEAMVDEAEVEDTHLRRVIGPAPIPREWILVDFSNFLWDIFKPTEFYYLGF